MNTLLTVVGALALVVVLTLAALGAAGYQLGAVDPAAVRDDDEFVDALARGEKLSDDELEHLLAAWRDDARGWP